jgi:hypothetical protein
MGIKKKTGCWRFISGKGNQLNSLTLMLTNRKLLIMKKIISVSILLCVFSCLSAQSNKHQFSFNKQDFLLDGKPMQIISGEMHPARIPGEYWRHRIQMARAMGCNTIAAYVFWKMLSTV